MREYRAFLFTNGGRTSQVVVVEDLAQTADRLAAEAYTAHTAGDLSRVATLTRKVSRIRRAMAH